GRLVGEAAGFAAGGGSWQLRLRTSGRYRQTGRAPRRPGRGTVPGAGGFGVTDGALRAAVYPPHDASPAPTCRTWSTRKSMSAAALRWLMTQARSQNAPRTVVLDRKAWPPS